MVPRRNQTTGGQLAAMNLTCIPANEVAFGFRWTRRTSLLELTTTRLAEDLRANESLALEAPVTILCENEVERSKDLVGNIIRTGTGRFRDSIFLIQLYKYSPFTMLSFTSRKNPHTGACHWHTMHGNKELQRPKNSSSSSSRSSQSNI